MKDDKRIQNDELKMPEPDRMTKLVSSVVGDESAAKCLEARNP
jgi:hypothetical protein